MVNWMVIARNPIKDPINGKREHFPLMFTNEGFPLMEFACTEIVFPFMCDWSFPLMGKC